MLVAGDGADRVSDLIRLAPGLKLDADYVAGGTFALLGKKGAGKSFTTRVLAEEFWAAGVQFVLIDPMGANWGLRSSADGKGEGLPIPIFGGEHADAPLERTAGKLMADLIVQDRLSMILDLSEFGSHAAERQFVLDLLEHVYRTNKELVHILLDEADLYAPQKPAPGDQAVKGVVDNVVRRGRNRAIAITLITQRSAVIDKDVLTQVDGVVLLRLTGPQDRDAAMRWVEDHGEAEQKALVRASLPELANGEAWVWIPELRVFERVQIRMSRTFDSSPTRTRKGRGPAPKGYADVDLSTIGEKIAATLERAKQEDPAELRKQMARLRKELAQRPTEKEVETVTETVEVPVLANGAVDRLEQATGAIAQAAQRVVDAVSGIHTELAQIARAPHLVPASHPRQAPARKPARTSATPAPAAAPREPTGDLTGPQQRVLDALAWLDAVGFPQPTKIQIGFIAGYRVGKKVGGTFGNILGELRSSGLIEYPTPGTAALSAEGATLAQAPDIERSTAGLQQAVYSRLDGPERRVLEVLVAAYPDALHKQEVGASAGYAVGEKVGGTFGNILGRLRSLGLVDYPQAGYAAATSVLFLERV